MIEILKKCFEDHKVISIYYDREDTCRHLTGYIAAFNEDEVAVQHITPNGLYDGFIVIHMNEVYEFNYDGRYEKKVEELYFKKKQSHSNFEIDQSQILFSVLAFAQTEKLIVCVELQDSFLTGYISMYDDEWIDIEALTEFGEYDGVQKVRLDEIYIFSVDTVDEQDIQLLLNKGD